MMITRSFVRARRVTRSAAFVLLGAGTLTACDSLLEANAPSRILESTLLQPSNAAVIVAGVVADVECAFGNYVAAAGTIADEFSDSQANAAIWTWTGAPAIRPPRCMRPVAAAVLGGCTRRFRWPAFKLTRR